jgi:Flp pilus assembly protein TadG
MRNGFKSIRGSLAGFGGDEKGAVLMEFGLLIPVMALLLMGSYDIGHSIYMTTVMQGVVQKASRDSGLETGVESTTQTAIDTRVSQQVKRLAKNATVSITRRYYKSFSKAAAAQAEPYTDSNGNGACDASEPYTDENNNSIWDADGSASGQGGAKDTVVYTVRASYPRMFPLHKMIGLSATTTIEAVTVLNNQPYGDQSSFGTPTVRNCA